MKLIFIIFYFMCFVFSESEYKNNQELMNSYYKNKKEFILSLKKGEKYRISEVLFIVVTIFMFGY